MVVAIAALGNKTSTVLFHFFEPFQHFLAFIISLSYRRRNVVRRGRGQAKVTLAPVFSAVMIAKLPPPPPHPVRKGQDVGKGGKAGGAGRDPAAPPPLPRARRSAGQQAPPQAPPVLPSHLLQVAGHWFNPSSECFPNHQSS